MAKVYRPYFPEQDFLLPPSLREWLAEDHLSYFVSDLIDQLDLSQIEQHYEREERGYPPYHPRMMTRYRTQIAEFRTGLYSNHGQSGLELTPHTVAGAGRECCGSIPIDKLLRRSSLR